MVRQVKCGGKKWCGWGTDDVCLGVARNNGGFNCCDCPEMLARIVEMRKELEPEFLAALESTIEAEWNWNIKQHDIKV